MESSGHGYKNMNNDHLGINWGEGLFIINTILFLYPLQTSWALKGSMLPSYWILIHFLFFLNGKQFYLS